QWESGPALLRNRRTWPYWFWPPSVWSFRNGVLRFNPHSPGAEDMEWLERCSFSLRRFHLDRVLNVQHPHTGHTYTASDSSVPGHQLAYWMIGRPYHADRLAPPVWACRECGNQYLLPATCCGREAIQRPQLFYLPALSPHRRARVEFSLVMLTHNGLAL